MATKLPVAGPVTTPGTTAYDQETATFQRLVPQRPALAVGATSAADVAAAVTHAARHDLPVQVLSSGHGTYFRSDGALLITTNRLDELTVDPAARRMRVGAGVRWQRAIEAAARYGLAPASGSAPGVGVVGYTLGGGLSPTLGRAVGYAADHVTAIELVTADGAFRRVTETESPDLFWALRGAGKGNFGIVTALEFGLFPVERLHAGGLFFAGEHADDVLAAWREWTVDAPEALSTSIALLRLPHLPGQLTVHVRVAYAGRADDAERLLAPLRTAAPPLTDEVGDLPYTAVASIHREPVDPVATIDGSLLLNDLPADFTRRLLDLAGPSVPAGAAPAMVEIRLLGGALARSPRVPNAVGHRDARYSVQTLSALPYPEAEGPARAVRDTLLRGLSAWDDGRVLPNWLTDDNSRLPRAFDAAAWPRLVRLKAEYDPANLFRINHNIDAATTAGAAGRTGR